MGFKQEELVEREREIAGYLLKDFSLKMVSQKIGLSLKHLAAHISNMRIKLKAKDTPIDKVAKGDGIMKNEKISICISFRST